MKKIIIKKYFSVVLTLDKNKQHTKNKDINYLCERIFIWISNYIENHKMEIYDGPWYDINDEGNSPHINITIISDCVETLSSIFKDWSHKKGFVHIEKVKELNKWLKYSKRNHCKMPIKRLIEIKSQKNTKEYDE